MSIHNSKLKVVLALILTIEFTHTQSILNVSIDTRIVGGEDAKLENFPYQVSIQYAGGHFCGGALILPDVVISAAHCFGASSSSVSPWYKVRVGSNVTTSRGQNIQICSVTIHEGYSEELLDNDISIVKLCSNATLSATVKTIRLSENDNYASASLAYVSGWGYEKENSSSLAANLKQAQLPITSRSSCRSAYLGAINITNTMLCAGFSLGGKDACQGDSGGPLVQNNQLIGVVSFGMGCARPYYPGVYCNVARFVDWVANHSDYQKSDNGGGGSWWDDLFNKAEKKDHCNRLFTVLAVICCLLMSKLKY